jgi:hypothetical protein
MESASLGLGESGDIYEPTLVKSRSLQNKRVLLITAGSQHTAFIATDEQTNGGEHN